jgi:signal recognition particle receptor subunit beta
MSVINYANRVIDFKIVYYGPGMAGKTANLQYIHRCLPNANRGNMISLATGDDRTIYFDFLPVSALTVRGFKTRFQLYTVPGQVQYNATRRLVLRGADGLVFVADSQFERLRENVESFRNLETNLREYESTLDEIPYVLQYNKRDICEPGAALSRVRAQSAGLARAVLRASAIDGRVFDTLNAVSRMALASEFGVGREKP